MKLPRTWRRPSTLRDRDDGGLGSSARRKPSKKGRPGPRRPPPSEPMVRLLRSALPSRGRFPAHPEAPLPRAPLEVVALAAAHRRYAETFRELLLPLQLRGAVRGLSHSIHLVAPLIHGRENPDGLSRALRPGVAVGEELPKPRRLPR